LTGVPRSRVGDLGRLLDMLELQPLAETAADVLVVKGHLFGVVSGDPGDLDLQLARDLVPVQTSTPASSTRTMAFSGSSGAWAT
jgi:hypothetical protein